MTGTTTLSVNLSYGVVAGAVVLSMVLGAVDLVRQPGWAWKSASEPKLLCLGLVLLLPGVGLAIYVFGARPKVVATATAGRAAHLPFERFGGREALATERGHPIQALALPTLLGSFGEPRPGRRIRASDSLTAPAAISFFDDPDVITVGSAGEAADGAGAVATVTAATTAGVRILGSLGYPYHPKQRTSSDDTGPMASVAAQILGATQEVDVPASPGTFRPTPQMVSSPAAAAPPGTAAKASPPARWMPDPTGRHQHRYWDGGRWAESVYDAGVESRDPVTG